VSLPPILERLGLMASIISARSALESSRPAPARAVHLRRLIEANRERLTGRAADPGAIDIRDPAGSLPKLRDSVAALQGQPPVERMVNAGYLKAIIANAAETARELGIPENVELFGLLADASRLAERSDAVDLQACEDMLKAHSGWAAAAGERLKALRTAIEDAGRQLNAEGWKRHEDKTAFVDADKRVVDAERAAEAFYVASGLNSMAPLGATWEERSKRDRDWHEYRRLRQAITDAREAADAEWEAANPPPSVDATRELRDAAIGAAAEIAKEAITKTMAASPVTPRQAEEWAAAQTIERAAIKALEKQGYSEAALRRDIAEFYRLTGGRLRGVIVGAPVKRAHADKIHGHSTGIIRPGARFDKRVLWHELAHHLEADPQALAAARGYLLRRREGPKIHRLKNLVPGARYGHHEVAWKDKFTNPYVGKVYGLDRSGAKTVHYLSTTEVFSMGVEAFNDPKVLAERMAIDPEHTALMMGYLTGQRPALFGAFQQTLTARQEGEAEAEDAAEEDAEKATAAAAKLVQWQPVPPEMLDAAADALYVGKRFGFDHWYGATTGYQAKLLGRYGTVIVHECRKLKNPRTGRAGKGYSLIRVSMEAFGLAGERLDPPRASVKWVGIFDSEAMARAYAALWDYQAPGASPPSAKPEAFRGVAAILQAKQEAA